MSLLLSRANLLILAIAISAIGGGIIPVAFAIASFRIDATGRLLSYVLIALWSAKLISSLALEKTPAPRFPVRQMIASACGCALAQFGLFTWLITFDSHHGIALIVSSFLYGLSSPWSGPGRFGLLAVLTSGQTRRQANSLISMLSDALFLAGPLLGTALTLGLGFTTVLIIDGLSLVIAIFLLATYWAIPSKQAPTPSTANPHGEIMSKTKVTLPRWVTMGPATWLIVSITIGFLGSGAPTLVMSRFSETEWGWVAATGAAGSLIGSFSAGLSVWECHRWNLVQLLTITSYGLHLVVLWTSDSIMVIALATGLSGLLTGLSGIMWDLKGQSFDSGEMVNKFAIRDQIVNTLGVPIGMLTFAALSHHTGVSLGIILTLLLASAICCLIPRANSLRADQ